MQLKKLLQGSAFALVAAACAIAVPSVVKAADGAFTDAGVSEVKVDGVEGTLTATTSGQELLVGFGKVNATKKTITVANWDSYDKGSGATTVDLSKLNSTKDNYVVLSSGANKPVSVVKIPAASKVTKAKFDAVNGELLVGNGKTAGEATPAEITTDTYEYRTAYGSWNPLYSGSAAVDLKYYQEEGAKLFVRLKGASDASAISKIGTEEYKYGDQNVKVYESASLSGKEVKVSIPAKAKGPKVVADYAKATVKFPKNSEYRIVGASKIYYKDSTAKTFFDSPADKTAVTKVFTDSKVDESDKTATLEVRTTKTTKKPASKWTVLAIAKPAEFESGAITKGTADTKPDASTINAGTSKEYGKKGVADSKLKVGEVTNVLNIQYATVSKKEVITIQNNDTKNTYEFVVKDKGTTASQLTDSDIPVKAASNGGKVTLKNLKDEQVVFIRVAGDKKGKTWPGAYAELGPVDLTKKVEGTKSVT